MRIDYIIHVAYVFEDKGQNRLLVWLLSSSHPSQSLSVVQVSWRHGNIKRYATLIRLTPSLGRASLFPPCLFENHGYIQTHRMTPWTLRSHNRPLQSKREIQEAREKSYAKKCARRSWRRFWCAMVCQNIWAGIRDVREGIRLPRRLRRGSHHRRTSSSPGPTDSFICCRCCRGIMAAPTGPPPAILAEAARDAPPTSPWRRSTW